MTATADIIDLAKYRKSRETREARPEAAAVPMFVSWVPVWVMVPVPVLPVATFA